MATTTTQIDPANSLRSAQINYSPTQANVKAGTATAGTITPQQAQAQQAQYTALDPAALQAANAVAGQGHGGAQLAHNIGASSVMRDAMKSFNAQMPQLDIRFADASDQLAKKTSAMGRTGSGLFNRDTGYISDRARADRESMLGNLSFQAATSDQAANLQAAIQSAQLQEAQQGRFSGASLQNAQLATQAAMANSGNQMQALMQNQQQANQMGQFNAGQMNNMSQFNVGNDLQAQGQNVGNQMQTSMFNVGNQLQADQFNTQANIGQNQFGANFMQGQQQYQNQLANQAQQDLYNQMNLFGQGFNGDPTQAMLGGAGGIQNIAGMYGQQAGQANQGIQQGTNALMQMLMGGGQQSLDQYRQAGIAAGNDMSWMNQPGQIIQQPQLPPQSPAVTGLVPRMGQGPAITPQYSNTRAY